MKSLDKNYYERIKDSSKPEKLRLRMIEILKENKYNISKTARMLHTTRTTIMKWRERYQEEGMRDFVTGQKDQITLRKKTPEHIKNLIIR